MAHPWPRESKWASLAASVRSGVLHRCSLGNRRNDGCGHHAPGTWTPARPSAAVNTFAE